MIGVEDHVAILALYARYNRAIDSGQANDWAATFAPDGGFHHPSGSWRGRERLCSFVADRCARIEAGPIGGQLHWNGPVDISGDPDRPTGSCALIVSGVDRASGRDVVVGRGRYEDRLVRTEKGWLFSERRVIVG